MTASRKNSKVAVSHDRICNCTVCMKSRISPKNIQRYEKALKATMVDRAGMESVMAHNILTAGSDINMLAATGLPVKELPTKSQNHSFQHAAVPELTLQAQWKNSNEEQATSARDASVFGALGVFVVPLSREAVYIPKMHALDVPPKILEKYGVTLIPLDETFHLEKELHPSLKKLFLIQYNFAPDYIDSYVMKLTGGGGVFVETHPFPQLFTPLSKTCSGALIVGKGDKSRGIFNLIALEIPFGYTLKIAPNVIHGDSFFVGPYAIALTETDLADSVLFRQDKSHPEVNTARGLQHVELASVPTNLLPLPIENRLIQEVNKHMLQKKVRSEVNLGNNRVRFFQSALEHNTAELINIFPVVQKTLKNKS